MSEIIPLVLDIIVLVFLGATIFYALRLSKNLNEFKKHRQDFNTVIADLLATIDQAERSIKSLKQTSAEKSTELQRLIDQSRGLADELKIINEAGENMAGRLERLAEDNRKAVQGVREKSKPPSFDDEMIHSHLNEDEIEETMSHLVDQVESDVDYGSTLREVKKSETLSQKDMPSFMIQDKEYMDYDTLENHLDASVSNDPFTQESDQEDDIMPEHLQSKAEKELFEALRRSRQNVTDGGQ